jgi:hypothetical protein
VRGLLRLLVVAVSERAIPGAPGAEPRAGALGHEWRIPREWVLRLAAPSLLVAVALGQFWLAWTVGLSPWKGGGFGMFSTVDAPSARFLRAHLLRASEEIPVLIPEGLQSLALETRTLPRREGLTRLAERLAGGTWVPYRFTTAVQRYLDLSGFPDLSRWPDRDPTDTGGWSDDRPIVFSGVPLLRMLGREEALRLAGDPEAFERVRLELWRYRFDAGTARLRASVMLEATADRPDQ